MSVETKSVVRYEFILHGLVGEKVGLTVRPCRCFVALLFCVGDGDTSVMKMARHGDKKTTRMDPHTICIQQTHSCFFYFAIIGQ